MVTHSNHVFRYYSMHWMRENCAVVDAKLGTKMMGPTGMGEVGGTDIGVPVTLKLTGETPQVVLETAVDRQLHAAVLTTASSSCREAPSAV